MRYNPFEIEKGADGSVALRPKSQSARRRNVSEPAPRTTQTHKGNPLIAIVGMMDDGMLERCHPPLDGVPTGQWRTRLLAWLVATPDAPDLLSTAWTVFVRCQAGIAAPAIEEDEAPVELLEMQAL